MTRGNRKVSTARFVATADLLNHAFPKEPATPDHLSHDCERAEEALLRETLKSCRTRDRKLARLLALTHRG